MSHAKHTSKQPENEKPDESLDEIDTDVGETEPAAQEEQKEVTIPEKLYEELLEKASERDDFFNKFLRAKADYENFRKRTNREMLELRDSVLEDFVEELLPVLDNLHRALAYSQENADLDTFIEGILIVEKEFLKVLEANNIVPIEALHKPFDPNLHEAVLQEKTDEFPNNTVVEELLKGYTLNGKVIRHSKVKVALNENDQ